MKVEEILSNLRQRRFAPVYLLCGEEAFYIDLVAEYLSEHVLDPSAREFDRTILYGKDLQNADIAQAVGLVRGFSMTGGPLVVIVREAQTVKKWDALKLYMDSPGSSQSPNILVICYKHGTPDMRLKAFKDFEKRGGVLLESNPLRDYQMPDWIAKHIRERLQERGEQIDIDPKIPRMLADYLGSNLTAVAGAVDKLLDGRPENCKCIDTALVERNIGISKDYNAFELQGALIGGDVLKANRITQYFASSKDHPMVKELPILYNFFANLMVYHYLPDKSDRAVASALGINPFFVRDYATAARRFSAAKTFAIIGYFRETDARLKGLNNPSVRDAGLWKELIYKILH